MNLGPKKAVMNIRTTTGSESNYDVEYDRKYLLAFIVL